MRRVISMLGAITAIALSVMVMAGAGGCAFIDGVFGSPEEGACEYEGDPAFCQRLDDECGRVTAPDNCGELREYVDCGRYADHQCESPLECVTTDDDSTLEHNRCRCPELGQEEATEVICGQANAQCGEIEAADICSGWASFETVQCGGCAGNRECGVESENECACPCEIGGQCYATGDVDPDDDCKVCDPVASRQSFVDAQDGVICEGTVDGALGYCRNGSCGDEECLESSESICAAEQYCADLRRDPDNCGSCGAFCGQEQFCHAGDCHPHRWNSYAIITGDQNGMTKLVSTGTRDWDFLGFDTTTETPLSLAVNPDRGAYVGTDLGNLYHLDKDGGLEWKFELPNDGEVWALAVDDSGDVYVGTGFTVVVDGGPEYAVYKIDAEGESIHWSFEGHSDRVLGISVAHEEAVYTASFDGTVRRLGLADGVEQWSFDDGAPGYYGVTAAGDEIVYATTLAESGVDGVVQKIEVDEGEPVLDWSYGGHDGDVWAAAVGPAGEVYSVGSDSTVRFIDSDEGWVFEEAADTVTGVSVDPDGFVYAASAEGAVFKIGPDGKLVARWLADLGTFSGVHEVATDAGERAAFPGVWDP